MRKRRNQLLEEYPRKLKAATRVVNNITSQNPNLYRQLGFSERERREESGTLSIGSD